MKNDVKPTDSPKPVLSWKERADVVLWLAGLALSGVLIGAIFVGGELRGWDAPSGYQYNESNNTMERFLPEPDDSPNAAAIWYFWRLAPDDWDTTVPKASVWTRLFAWLGYAAHQMSCWLVIYLAQREERLNSLKDRYHTSLRWYNYAAFAVNIFFHALHFVNTHTTYDGTAPDVTIASSQSSVIMLLIWILIIDYRERGLFFGWPALHQKGTWTERLRLSQLPTQITRRYHGYLFSWAAIYTFWYHPMENTWGHCMGFWHTYAILLQGSLLYTPMHKNIYWRVFLETWVTLHSTVVAVQTSNPWDPSKSLWPMFCFGFLLVIVLTQIFSLPFWRKIHWIFRFSPLILYIGLTVGCYSQIPNADGVNYIRMPGEIVRIPGMYYMYFFIAWITVFALFRLAPPALPDQPSTVFEVIYLSLSFFVVLLFVAVSAIFQATVEIALINQTFILVAIFTVGAGLVYYLLDKALMAACRPHIPVKTASTALGDNKEPNPAEETGETF